MSMERKRHRTGLPRTILYIAGAAAIAAFIVSRQCDDGHGLTDEKVQNLACGEILGS